MTLSVRTVISHTKTSAGFSRRTITAALAPSSLLLLLLAFGCATFNVEQGYELKPVAEKGILAVGFTFEQTEPSGSWYFRRIDRKAKGFINFSTYRDPATWTRPFGRLAIIELDPGEYEFYDWGQPRLEPETYFSIPFSIASGRVTYLGRLHLTVGDTAFHLDAVDGFSEDRTLIASRISGLTDDRIDLPQTCITPCRTGECAKPSRWPLVPPFAPAVARLRLAQ